MNIYVLKISSVFTGAFFKYTSYVNAVLHGDK